jgi:ABC-type cobalamin/Fe3+-siderophores transport system ATPase subunit
MWLSIVTQGAGKSTILLSMFHMIIRESGSIYIDDIDIFTIGLDDLRFDVFYASIILLTVLALISSLDHVGAGHAWRSSRRTQSSSLARFAATWTRSGGTATNRSGRPWSAPTSRPGTPLVLPFYLS